MNGRTLWAGLPIALFALIAVLFGFGLRNDPQKLPSALLNKPVPEFTLAPLEGAGKPGFATADLKDGRPSLVNVFASWCVPCRDEHPVLLRLSQSGKIRVLGINYKDEPANANAFLGELGNPYAAIGSDRQGRVGIDWGVYGVPESYLVDGSGVIRQKFVGPLTDESVASTLLPAIAALGN